MSKYDWLLFLHITGAFLLLGGGVVAAALNMSALRRDRPSQILLLFGLIRIAVASIIAGTVLAFVFGLWLVNEVGYGYGDGWIVAAIVLLILGNAIGGFAGSRDARTAKFAQQLVAQGDAPSDELRARVRDPITFVCNYGSGLILVALLAIMIWKPGA
ncbi:MAG: DUF2269 domain-containing protein [Actinomycetota bacterium]|nr:DUF2269 domain-containing protein [Actinomycetota bacterium]